MTSTRTPNRPRTPADGAKGRRRRPRRGDDGYVLALVGLLLIPMLMASALAVDVGSWYARITQIQRAADAAALAGTIWMPDLTKATAVANESLAKNGIVNGVDGMSVTIGQGKTSTSLKVTVREAKADAYFSQVLGWTQSLSRYAEAEYFLPLPLGSPLNYFGGDASKNAGNSDDPPSDSTTRRPTNYSPSGCKIKGSSNAWWRSNGTYSTSSRPNNLTNCLWAPTVTQINPSRSPGFWAMVAGPGTLVARGDAYSTVCNGTTSNCGAPVQGNKMYRSTGYWYVIKMPDTLPSQTKINVYDAAYFSNNGTANNAGDTSLEAGGSFTTEYRVYRQDNPLDINVRTALSSSPGTADDSCYWRVTNETAFQNQWRTLCTINPTAGSTYLLNVRTTSANFTGSGLNGYAVEAVASGSRQPAVYAYGDMMMFNNIASGDATFYLAEVGPEFAGKVLTIDLWDPGDTTDDATLYPMMPSLTATKPVRPVARADCTYTSSPSPNAAVSSSNSGFRTGEIVSTPHASDVSGQCGVITNTGGTDLNRFNNEWLRVRVKVPADYTCTKGLNPETTAGSCWWGVKYNFAGPAQDVTTWKAAIEGNPVHLVE